MAADIFDVAVIGAGIAGASAAAELARDCRVALLEMESRPGFHTTGRSAAIFAPTYGPAPIRALTRASAGFFHAPPAGFCDAPLLSRRGVVMLARDDQLAALDRMFDEVAGRGAVTRLDRAALHGLLPLLRAEYGAAGMFDAQAMDIDVNALHQGCLRQLRQRGGALIASAPVTLLTREQGGWIVTAGGRDIRAGVVVNAAGAWAEAVGALAGARPIGLVPKRRTALIVASPPGRDPGGWPLAVDVEEAFYMKPEAGKLLISPADETPSPPCDAQPEELDAAICIDRIETAFDIRVARIEHKWAGLRSFVADKAPAVGFDARVEGFFWLAGQGGYGIQTAPALARLTAALAQGRAAPADILDQGFDPGDVAPARGRDRQATDA